jgi:phytoene synthase
MVEPSSIEESYRYAARLTRAKARNFAYSFWFLSPERRRAIAAVYAYSRRLDDCVDAAVEGCLDREEARRGLDRLRALLQSEEGDPLGPALADTIRRFSIPLAPFHDLIAGMEMDLEVDRYATFEELRGYCYRAASTVGLICIEIFGNDGAAARPPAIDLGIAMQLTNVLRDIPEDLRRGRIYLPREDLARFGYSEEDLARQVVNGAFQALMAFQVSRARDYFARAAGLLSHLKPESRRCPALLASFYLAILDRIERANHDVFLRRPRLSLGRKLALAGTQIFRSPTLAPSALRRRAAGLEGRSVSPPADPSGSARR